jgi:hypothetical protein
MSKRCANQGGTPAKDENARIWRCIGQRADRLEPARRNAVHRSGARLRTRCPQIVRRSRRGIRVRRLFAKYGTLTYDSASIGKHKG